MIIYSYVVCSITFNSFFNDFNSCILTQLLHICDLLVICIFPVSNTSAKMAEKGRNVVEEYRTIVYYCT